MTEQPSTARVALKWGVMLGIALMLITLLMYLTSPTGNIGFTLHSTINTRITRWMVSYTNMIS